MILRTANFRPSFLPGVSCTVKLTASTTAATTALTGVGDDMLLQNVGSEIVALRWGDSGVTAATEGDFILPPGTSVIVARMGATHISALALANTSVVYATAGAGG